MTVLINGQYPCFAEALRKYGFKVVFTEAVEAFLKPEQAHADMQALKIGERLFLLREYAELKERLKPFSPVICRNRAEQKYPRNVLLNCLYFKNRLYAKRSAVDPAVSEYCAGRDIPIISVSQGYTRCSTLIAGVNAVITADKGIAEALKKSGAEVLLISPGSILLDGFDYGFIGGAGFYYNGTVYFFGNVQKHPEYEKIKGFIEKNNSKTEILQKEMPLTDIGGAVTLTRE